MKCELMQVRNHDRQVPYKHSKDDPIISASVKLSLKSKGTCVLHYATWTKLASLVTNQSSRLTQAVVNFILFLIVTAESEITTILGF